MPPPWGLTPTGINIPRLEDVRAEIEARWREEFGENADLSAQSPDGQIVGIMSEREASWWEALEQVYAAGNPDSASGAPLDEQAALSGIAREGATRSTVLIACAGTPTTLLAAGRVIELDDTGSRWISTEDATIGAGGTVDVTFEAEDTGPIQALAGSAWTIASPVGGWAGATNAADAELGRNEESNEALRVRRRQAMVAVGPAAEALLAALVRIDGVTECKVIENESGVSDSEGRPGKSFEVIIRGGADQTIIDTIWATKPLGIESYGTSEGVALDSQGVAHTIRFTRPEELPIWITVEIEAGDEFPSNGRALVRAEVLAHEDALTTGDDVLPWKIKRGIETDGIEDLELLLGTTAVAQTPDRIVVGSRQVAVFDSSRITVRLV